MSFIFCMIFINIIITYHHHYYYHHYWSLLLLLLLLLSLSSLGLTLLILLSRRSDQSVHDDRNISWRRTWNVSNWVTWQKGQRMLCNLVDMFFTKLQGWVMSWILMDFESSSCKWHQSKPIHIVSHPSDLRLMAPSPRCSRFRRRKNFPWW